MTFLTAMSKRSFSKQHQRGVGLVEVLVAVLVLAVGMLGVAVMQLMALRNNQSAVQRSAAVTQTYAILDALRADRDRAGIGQYDIPNLDCGIPDAGTFIQDELRNWVVQTKTQLGQPDDQSTCVQLVCTTTQCLVEIQWDDSRASGGNAGSGKDGKQAVRTVSQL